MSDIIIAYNPQPKHIWKQIFQYLVKWHDVFDHTGIPESFANSALFIYTLIKGAIGVLDNRYDLHGKYTQKCALIVVKILQACSIVKVYCLP